LARKEAWEQFYDQQLREKGARFERERLVHAERLREWAAGQAEREEKQRQEAIEKDEEEKRKREEARKNLPGYRDHGPVSKSYQEELVHKLKRDRQELDKDVHGAIDKEAAFLALDAARKRANAEQRAEDARRAAAWRGRFEHDPDNTPTRPAPIEYIGAPSENTGSSSTNANINGGCHYYMTELDIDNWAKELKLAWETYKIEAGMLPL
jgi:hypothetical protein